MSIKEIITLSGLSGAGKSTAARALEDLGYHVVDNLPPTLLPELIRLLETRAQSIEKLGWVVDARESTFLCDFDSVWRNLANMPVRRQLLYFEASDDVLIRRYQETRRKHPLEQGEGIRLDILSERSIMSDMRARADTIIYTDELNTHELRDYIKKRFRCDNHKGLVLSLLSFGYKHGLPSEVDLCFDARFLPNPYFVLELREKTGLDAAVSDYVLKHQQAQGLLERIENFTRFLLPHYISEGKHYLTLGIGCTGGKHRAPALTQALFKRLQPTHVSSQNGELDQDILLRMEHRDVFKK
jgi:UPF0042 nucleotide-binding protein